MSSVAERANPRALPQPLTTVCALLALAGIGAFLWGLASDKETTWIAFHTNYLFFGAMAQGGLIISCIFVIVGARWPGPVRRIAEGLAAWVPVTLVLGVIGYFGRDVIYANWLGHPPPGKEAWLNSTRLYATDISVFAILALLTVVYLKASVRPTLKGAADRATAAKGMFESWSSNWRGDEEEREESGRRMRVLAPIICLVFAFGWTAIAIDQVMSLEPTWFSNLFGAYFAWGGFLTAVAATAVLCVWHRNAPGLEGEFTEARFHDLGKMVFAFSVFWMYLFFSQYLVIWYGNLPEETQFIQGRLGSQFLQDTIYFVGDRLREPYAMVTLSVWVCCWIIPFVVLLGQRPKKTPAILGTVCVILILGFWLERNVLIWPSLRPDDSFAWAGVIQFTMAAGFFGAFSLVYLVYTRVFPSLAVPERS